MLYFIEHIKQLEKDKADLQQQVADLQAQLAAITTRVNALDGGGGAT